MSTRLPRLARPSLLASGSARWLAAALALLLISLVAVDERGLVLITADASPAPAASPAQAPGSGGRQARKPRKKRRAKSEAKPPVEPAEEKPAEPTEAEPPPESATGAGAAGSGAGASSPSPASSTTPGAATGMGTGTTPAPPGAGAGTIVNTTSPEVASSAELVDVDALRQEYLQLRDELFRSRARASTLSSQLYTTKITIRFAFTTGRHYGVNKASIRLDGASVFDDAEGAVANDDAVRFEGFIAPGKHLLTFRIETTGKDDDRFTSAQETQVAVQAVAGKDLVVIAKAKDGGDIAYQWKKGEKGNYGLGIDVSVKTQKRAEAKAGK
jgi:hypothetical protein